MYLLPFSSSVSLNSHNLSSMFLQFTINCNLLQIFLHVMRFLIAWVSERCGEGGKGDGRGWRFPFCRVRACLQIFHMLFWLECARSARAGVHKKHYIPRMHRGFLVTLFSGRFFIASFSVIFSNKFNMSILNSMFET